MRICSDPGKLRRQRLWDGGAAGGTLMGLTLIAHLVWPMQSWPTGGFWALAIALLLVGGYVSVKSRLDGRIACLDDAGVSAQIGWSIRRLPWSEVRSVSRAEHAMGAYRLDFQGERLGVRVDTTVFADEQALFALVRRHLPWADTEHWGTQASFRLENRVEN